MDVLEEFTLSALRRGVTRTIYVRVIHNSSVCRAGETLDSVASFYLLDTSGEVIRASIYDSSQIIVRRMCENLPLNAIIAISDIYLDIPELVLFRELEVDFIRLGVRTRIVPIHLSVIQFPPLFLQIQPLLSVFSNFESRPSTIDSLCIIVSYRFQIPYTRIRDNQITHFSEYILWDGNIEMRCVWFHRLREDERIVFDDFLRSSVRPFVVVWRAQRFPSRDMMLSIGPATVIFSDPFQLRLCLVSFIYLLTPFLSFHQLPI